MIFTLGGITEYQYQKKNKSFEIKQSTIHATICVLIQLSAKLTAQNQEIILWRNSMVNSPFAVMPIR